MTPDAAGRELDALVAEKVMGTEKYWAVMYACSHYGSFTRWEDAEKYAAKLTSKMSRAFIVPYYDEPHYSASIEDAWPVHEQCCKLIFSKRQIYFNALTQAIRDDAGQPIAWPNALMFLKPHHICLAALAVYEVAP